MLRVTASLLLGTAVVLQLPDLDLELADLVLGGSTCRSLDFLNPENNYSRNSLIKFTIRKLKYIMMITLRRKFTKL